MNRRIDMETCRDQHDAIRILLEKFPTTVPVQPDDVAKLLARLFAILAAHLKLEDDRLYPALERSADLTIQETARRYRIEMGGLKQTFGTFMSTWGNQAAIAADEAAFMSAWSAVRSALEARMEKEDQGLYVIAETVAR